MEVVSGDNWSYKTAELQSVVHANKPTPSCLQVLLPNQQYQEHWREKMYHISRNWSPEAHQDLLKVSK